MINKDSIFPIGQILKPHGIHGEMSFSFTTDVFDTEDVPFVILEKEGLFIPFYIDEYRFKGSTTGLLKLDGVKSDEQAREFMGLTIYLPKSYLEKVEDDEIELDYFVGFTLVEEEKGVLGIISEVDQTTENVLFVIPLADDELLIPAGQDYIKEIDHDKKIIYMQLPDGLLDL